MEQALRKCITGVLELALHDRQEELGAMRIGQVLPTPPVGAKLFANVCLQVLHMRSKAEGRVQYYIQIQNV